MKALSIHSLSHSVIFLLTCTCHQIAKDYCACTLLYVNKPVSSKSLDLVGKVVEELQKAWLKGTESRKWKLLDFQTSVSRKQLETYISFCEKNDNSAEPRYQSVEARTMVSHLQAGVELSPNQGTFNMCLDGFQNCCGSVCVPPVFPFGIKVSVAVLLCLSQQWCMLAFVGGRGQITCLFS